VTTSSKTFLTVEIVEKLSLLISRHNANARPSFL